MIVPCEMATKAVVPAIRAMIAKELSQSYKRKQGDIATLLGITQSAVSQYLSHTRGKALDLEGVREVEVVVKDVAHLLITRSSSPRVLCQKYCKMCRVIREKRILCQLHLRVDPTFDTTDCEICLPTSTACF